MTQISSSNINKKLLTEIIFIVDKVFQKQWLQNGISSTQKDDRTPVTEIDLEISSQIKILLQSNPTFKSFNYLSEEDQGKFQIPVAVVDPIDGTKELIKGNPECALSFALFDKNQENDFALIYNPFNHFCVSNQDPIPSFARDKNISNEIALISRSEWEMALYEKYKKTFVFIPIGSIAYKLGLLYRGIGSFVMSMRGKHIWDIAAGTILCEKIGIKLHSLEGEIVDWRSTFQFNGPLIWCPPEKFPEIQKHFSNLKN